MIVDEYFYGQVLICEKICYYFAIFRNLAFNFFLVAGI